MSADRLPPLPSLRALTAELRAINQAYSHPDGGPDEVYLVYVYPEFGLTDGGWRLLSYGNLSAYRMHIPSVKRACPNPNCRNGWRLTREDEGGPESCRRCGGAGEIDHMHSELVPGDCFPDGRDAQLNRDATGAGDLSKWDATTAARRLLAAARDALNTSVKVSL